MNWGVEPSLVGLAFLIQSVRCRTKSKKKSPSGTEMTLSAILTNKLKPSGDRRFNRCAMFWQKSLARVDESTSKAWKSDRPFWKWSYCIYFWDTCTEVHLFTSNVDLLASIHYCRRLPILEHVRPLFCSSLQILCWCRTKSINFWI